jgi:leucyl aminopeptidase
MAALSILPKLIPTSDVKDSQFDGVIIVTATPENLSGGHLAHLQAAVQAYKKLDKSNNAAIILCNEAPGGRIILVPTGPVTRDYDDVRRFADAAEKGIARALDAGCKAPLLIGHGNERYPLAVRVIYLGALQALYSPLEVREAKPDLVKKVLRCGLLIDPVELEILLALETGR